MIRPYLFTDRLSSSKGPCSELVLRDENENLSNGASDERGAVIDFHAEIQLDLLRSRNAARHHQNRLRRCGSFQSEARLGGARDAGRRTNIHQRHGELYRRFGLMTTSHCEELQLTGGRDRQHAHEGDEIVGVMRGQSEAGQVVHSTVLGGAYAAAEIASILYPGIYILSIFS